MANSKYLKKLPFESYWEFNIGWANEATVNVCITPDIRKSREHRDPILGELPDKVGQPVGLFCGKGRQLYIFLGPIFDPDTVAHESYHAVDYIMAYLGVEHRDAEVMAYHLGWIVGKISEIYLKIKKEKRSKKVLTSKKTKRKVVPRGKRRQEV